MQSYYIPCAQQDRPQGHQHVSGKSNAFLHRTPSQGSRQSEKRRHSTSPLGYATASSLQSPPQTSVTDGSAQVSSQPDANEVAEKDGWNRAVLRPSSATSLPSRPKAVAQHKQRRGQEKATSDIKVAPQVTIQETAVRSRLARRTTAPIEDILSVHEPSQGKSIAVVTANSRCHARRRACADPISIAPPPKLKRDTDCTDAIVKLIVCFSTKLVHTIWSPSTATSKSSNGFNGAGVLPLHVFIQETLRRSKTSYSTLQVALFYLILLKPYVGVYHSNQDAGSVQCRALQCGRRMFLTALILASKYLQDRNYSSRAWSKISGLPISEINDNERKYLRLIQFNLHMKKETFENWSKIVLTLCKVGEASMNKDMSKRDLLPYEYDASMSLSGAMVDDTSVGSEQWWSRQLRRLSEELVADTKQTEAFLGSLTSLDPDTDVESEQTTASLDTPPSSPDSIGDVPPEHGLAKLLSATTSGACKTEKVDYAPSPATANLPSKPSLPNLPTPQSTPRYHNVLPPPYPLSKASARCKASSQALLGLDRQAVNVANLEMCPPPKPRAFEHGRHVTNTPMTTSPESMISDTSSYTSRSRSSSVSSVSSVWWPSVTQSSVDDHSTRFPQVRKENMPPVAAQRQHTMPNIPASYSFYNAIRPVTTFEDEGIVVDRNTGACLPLNHRNLARFQDEGYGSDGYGCSDRDKSLAEQEVANVLASLNGLGGVETLSCPAEASVRSKSVPVNTQSCDFVKKSKRGRSSTSEEFLQNNVRSLLLSEEPSIDSVASPFATSTQDKETQFPVKAWACSKKPISNSMHTKRFAMEQCYPTPSDAPGVAASFLMDIAMVR